MSDVRALLVDPEPESRDELAEKLREAGYHITPAGDWHGVHELLAREVPDAVLLASAGVGEEILDLVSQVKERFEFLPTIVIVSKADASMVAEGMRRGAFDFLSKPIDFARLEFSLKSAAHLHRLMIKVNQLQSQYQRRGQFRGLIGISPRMQTTYSIIENVGETDVTVFVTGPSGTGKELIAKAIHDVSHRAKKRFVAVNCAAIPQGLLESELFGHEKGSFTGATSRYLGSCEQANGGTLFLDEICEMDFDLQSKLLRFLQEKRFHRLGGKEEISVDARVLAATNRDPLEEVRGGRLREDLYYRLNVVPIEVPPLRERKEDIPLLANHFLERFSSKYGKYFYDFTPEAMGAMLAYDWHGNVREIENMIERIVVLYNGSQVTEQMLPQTLHQGRTTYSERQGSGEEDLGAEGVILPMQEVERRAIERALSICRGNVSQAARRLQIGQATLYRKIKKYNLVPNRV
ncbi:MAG: sigma-54-dependent transcriptional regulator [Planctomycetota bacterium]|jgi:DNA-binding NtrC family response regulator